MTVSAERRGNEIVLEAPMVLKDSAKEVPGARYDSKTRTWRYPLTWAHCVMLRGVFGARLEVGPELSAWATEEKVTRVIPALRIREER